MVTIVTLVLYEVYGGDEMAHYQMSNKQKCKESPAVSSEVNV